jgi:hypothetical protein
MAMRLGMASDYTENPAARRTGKGIAILLPQFFTALPDSLPAAARLPRFNAN